MNTYQPRIAIATQSLALGGTTTFLLNLGGELVRRGIPTQIFSFEKANPLISDFQHSNVQVIRCDERRLIFEDRMKDVLHYMSHFKPTVVIANLGPVAFETLRYAPEGAVRVAALQSDDPHVYETLRHYITVTDVIAAVSTTIKQKIQNDRRFFGVRVEYLPYGVPVPADRDLPPSGKRKPLRILYLGRLEQEQKRVRLFPKILKHLEAAAIPFHWTIAGEGQDRPFLETAMRTKNPGQSVSMPGLVNYRDIPNLLSAHDIYILTSIYEGLPLSMLEAMGHGLVPIVSDLPSGTSEVVDRDVGRLVSPDDIQGYAEAIIELHRERDELSRLSRNAHARIQDRFSVRAMTDRWVNIFPKGTKDIVWPTFQRIKAPLVAKNPIYFANPTRAIRRLTRRCLALAFSKT